MLYVFIALLIGYETELNWTRSCSNQIFPNNFELNLEQLNTQSLSLCILRYKHPNHVIEVNFFININQVSFYIILCQQHRYILTKVWENQTWNTTILEDIKSSEDINCSKSLYMHIIIYLGKRTVNKRNFQKSKNLQVKTKQNKTRVGWENIYIPIILT